MLCNNDFPRLLIFKKNNWFVFTIWRIFVDIKAIFKPQNHFKKKLKIIT